MPAGRAAPASGPDRAGDHGAGRRGGRRGLGDRRYADDPARPGDETAGEGARSRIRASAWLRRGLSGQFQRRRHAHRARAGRDPRGRSGAGAGDRGLRLPRGRSGPAGRDGGARRAQHPVDALSGERNRRYSDRAAGAWRADRVRRRRGAADEPAGDDRRRGALLGGHGARRGRGAGASRSCARTPI